MLLCKYLYGARYSSSLFAIGIDNFIPRDGCDHQLSTFHEYDFSIHLKRKSAEMLLICILTREDASLCVHCALNVGTSQCERTKLLFYVNKYK